MRLLIMMPTNGPGGVHEYCLTIAKAALQKGWEAHAAFPHENQTMDLVHRLQDCGTQVRHLAIDENWEDQYRLSYWHHGIRCVRVLSCLRTVKPTAVLLVLPLPYFCVGAMLACSMLKVPTALVFQLVFDKTYVGPKLLRAYHWAKSRRQEWIAVSRANRRILCSSFGLGEEDIHVIHNGPSSMKIDALPSEQVRQEVRREFGLNANDRLLLSVGRLAPQKGYLDLVAIIPQILREFPDITFAWVGEGVQRKQLEDEIREKGIDGRVRLLGYRGDVPRLLRAADLFVFPSHFEGQPLALAEAMTAGLPIVSSDASGISEVIDSGVHGLLYPARDCTALAGALRWALQNPTSMKTMGQNAVSRASEFSADKMANQTLSLINSLATNRITAKDDSGIHAALTAR